MRFQVERDGFADAVAWSSKSLPSRTPVPILGGVLLRLDGDTLQVSGFDYEVSTQVNLDARADEGGAAVVSGRLLAEITKTLPAKPVEVTKVGERLAVVCGSTRFTLPTMPVEDYPELPQLPEPVGAVKAAEFHAAVAQVIVAAGRDDTLPVLTGVRMDSHGDKITLMATDRYRLAISEVAWQPETPDDQLDVLVPARALGDAAKSFNAVGGDVTIAVARDTIVGFTGGSRLTTSRLLEGAYPPVQSIVPTTHRARILVSVREMIEVARRMSLVASQVTPLRLNLGENGLVVEAGSQSDAQASDGMDIAFEGEPMQVALNPQYLLDGLGMLNSPKAQLSFLGPNKQVAIRPVDEYGEVIPGCQYIVMSVRTS